MQYQSDYILRLIEQMGSLIRRAMERLGAAHDDETYDLTSQAVGLALDMDPDLAMRLSPQSLRSLLEIDLPDERVLGLVVQALELQADTLDMSGEMNGARVRREQAAAVREILDPTLPN